MFNSCSPPACHFYVVVFSHVCGEMCSQSAIFIVSSLVTKSRWMCGDIFKMEFFLPGSTPPAYQHEHFRPLRGPHNYDIYPDMIATRHVLQIWRSWRAPSISPQFLPILLIKMMKTDEEPQCSNTFFLSRIVTFSGLIVTRRAIPSKAATTRRWLLEEWDWGQIMLCVLGSEFESSRPLD